MAAFPLNGAIYFPIPRGLAGHPARDIWGIVRFRMSDDGGPAWPSVESIAADAGIKRRAVQKALRRLGADGWIVLEPGGGRGHTSRVWAIIPDREAVVAGVVTPTNGALACAFSPEERANSRARKGALPGAQRAHRRAPEERQRRETGRKDGGAAALPSGPPPAALNGSPGSASDAALLRRVGACGFTYARHGKFFGALRWHPCRDGGRFIAVDREGRSRRVMDSDKWIFFGGPAAREACRAARWPDSAVRLVEIEAGAGDSQTARACEKKLPAATASPAMALCLCDPT